MGFFISKIISNLILPPSSLIILLLIGIGLIIKKRLVWGKRLVILSTIGLIVLSLPITAMTLMSFNEPYPALTNHSIQNAKAEAIIILGGGRNYDAEEYGGDTVSEITLERIRYGVRLHRQTNLPILVTGGAPLHDRVPEGELMATALQQDFQVSPNWKETNSRNTAENAMFSYEILAKENVKDIFLVTHAWHLSRAVKIFEQQGFRVTPAPTAFEGFGPSPLVFVDFLPNAKAFLKSYYALHEIIGRVWYAIRY
jgi:uncharacterized SAM-binding protein YcdF (DUF218 family)